MMMESAVMDEEEWPTLVEAKLDNEEWEMLQQESTSTTETISANNTSFEMVVVTSTSINTNTVVTDCDEEDNVDQLEQLEKKPQSVPQKQAKNMNMRHCSSSPNLSSMNSTTITVLNSSALDAVMEEELDSFSLISGPASVMTASTNTGIQMRVSFRDAFMASPGRAEATTDQATNTTTSSTTTPPKQRSRIQPKFVVVASPPSTTNFRRCVKSTGDLQSLMHDEDDEHGASGACDAMEFYHRKATGSASRSNGLKLRPDEAKRRDMIVQKKALQRQQQTTTTTTPTKSNKARSK